MSFRQVLFMAGGVGVCFLLYFTLSFMPFLMLSLIVMGISASLAFGKYQGLSLAKIAVNFVSYLMGGRQYLWKKKAVISQAYAPPQMKEEEEESPLPVTRKSRLEDLATQLETHRPQQ